MRTARFGPEIRVFHVCGFRDQTQRVVRSLAVVFDDLIGLTTSGEEMLELIFLYAET